MKKFWVIFLVLAVAMVFGITSHNAMAKKDDGCIKIKDSILVYSAGRYLESEPIEPGFDSFGYNYQAHIFNGYFCNYYLNVLGLPPYEGDDVAYYGRLVDEGFAINEAEAGYLMSTHAWLWDYRNEILVMKWNDAWLSNKDCLGDGLLDRHYPLSSYIGSGAWCTNHQTGTCVDVKAKERHWTYFVKIVSVPDSAYLVEGIWFTADDTEIGPSIWGQHAIVQEVENNLCTGVHGAQYVSPAGPGLGKFK